MEKIVETKQCKHCDTTFSITDKDLEFYKKISPKFNGEVFQIPTPTLCSECRQQRRLSFRNERNLYKRKCDATGEDIVSIYSPDKLYTIYSQDFWWSDKWDTLDYQCTFNSYKSFFHQFKFQLKNVPLMGLYNLESMNSEYNCWSIGLKDCYLMSGANINERCSYGNYMNNNISCVDNLMTHYSENCYECIDCTNSYNLFYSNYSTNCRNSLFLQNCADCEKCIGCVNLVGKKFFIFNKQVTKKEYDAQVQRLNNTIYIKAFKEKFNDFLKKQITKSVYGSGNEDVSGNNIYNSNYIYNCFDVTGLENCKYCTWFHDSSDCYDVFSWGKPSELLYESVATGDNSSHVMFSFQIQNCYNLFYCISCMYSNNCFGCIGLKNKQYCILNKQYTKEEYNKLVPKIVKKMQQDGEWGEFFPSSLSPFGYNETVAQEYFPLTREEALEKGFSWSDYESPKPQVEKIILASKLPKNIKDVPDDILNWAIECEVTKKPFRIIPQELDFYRKHNLPIPKRHPDQRHLDRMKLRNPRRLFERNCDKCSVEMQTTYAPDREEVVYCEACYNKEIY